MSNLVVKIKFGEDNRRVTVGANLTFSQLVELLGQLFPSSPSGSLTIKYLDDDEDMVTISSDLELKEAVGMPSTQSAQVLRLIIFPKMTTPIVEPQTQQIPPPSSRASPPSPSPTSSQPSPSPFSFPQFQLPTGNPFGMLNNLNLNTATLQPLITQALANPQILALLPQILPLIQQFSSQLNAVGGNNGNNNSNLTKPVTDIANDLTNLFRNLGVNQQSTTPSQPTPSSPLEQFRSKWFSKHSS